MNVLYGNYRGEHYLQVRNKWEAWYDKNYNAAHDDNAWSAGRARKIMEFLKPFIKLEEHHVIDIGGDTGTIARMLNAKSVQVTDISDRQENKVIEIVEGKKIALLSHVLEHVECPVDFISDLLFKYDLVYVEVPYGTPAGSWLRKNKFGQFLQLFFSLHPRLWSTISRPATGRHSKHLVLCQSEHLTFFKEESLRKMGQVLGCKVEVEKTEIYAPDKSRATVIQCLFSQ